MGRRLALLLFYSLVSVVYSWPAALDRSATIATRQFDGWGVVWVTAGSRRFLGTPLDPTTNWPIGASLLRMDSLVHVHLSALLLEWLSPVSVLHLLMVVGPVLSALAAERCARRAFGVAAPWSAVAGLAFGFSGLTATACLEGHVYLLLDPWLPLLLTDLHLGLQPGGRRESLLRAVLWGVLAAATSAYVGLAAALVVAVWVARALWVRGPLVGWMRGLAPALVLAVGAGLVYAWSFAGDGLESTPTGWAPAGVLTPRTALSWTPTIDLVHGHSIAAPLGALPLAALLLGWGLLRWRTGWRGLAIASGASMVIAVGSTMQLSNVGGLTVPMPMGILRHVPIVELIHFPVRLLAVHYLAAGTLAAIVLQEAVSRFGWRVAAPGLALALGDAFIPTGMPFRLPQQLTEVPSAYDAAPTGRPVLDVTATSIATHVSASASSADALSLFRTLSCYYQTGHGRPILESCFMPGESPRVVLSEALAEACVHWADAASDPAAGDSTVPGPGQVRDLLESIGVGAIAVHVDLFPYEQRAAVLAGVEAVAGPPVARSTDGGETLVLFTLPEVGGSPRAAWLAYAASLSAGVKK